MFKIKDGREHFYQWDLDRELIVNDPTIKEVHYCNRTDECSLVVDVVDGIAPVPNLILQHSFDVRVFAYDGNATRYEQVFKVKPRTKPADYVYTETEIKTYKQLEARIDEIEKNGISGDVVTKEELENTLRPYATQENLHNMGSTFAAELEKCATKEELKGYAKTTDIPNVSAFQTEAQVNALINNALSGIATAEEGSY